MLMDRSRKAAVIGAGPAGLMAAEVLLENNICVDIFEAKPTIGRKFLMAGKTATSQVRRITMEEREEGIKKNEELPEKKNREMV